MAMKSTGQHGGRRPGAGRKKKSLEEKILEGKADAGLDEVELEGEDMPPIDDYMKAEQKNGIELRAAEIFRKTYSWVKKNGCLKYVPEQLMKNYAMTTARQIQCDMSISQYGFIAKGKNDTAVASPYVMMSQSYSKLAQQQFYEIANIVKEHSTASGGVSPQDDLMEALLSGKA